MVHPFEGGASHLDLFSGLPLSWSTCLVLLLPWTGIEPWLGLEVVLGETVPDPCLPALLHIWVLVLLLHLPLLHLLPQLGSNVLEVDPI